MRSPSGARSASPEPLVELVPSAASSVGPDMVELAAEFDLIADPWQERVLSGAGGERADGKHAARDVGIVVPRQNGKDGILEMRTLGGLLILGEGLITYSAHQFDTSLEAFRRLLHFFENYDDLSKRVKRVSKSHGEEGIELTSGQRVRFRTRTAGGGRGFTGDCLFLNEAMILRETSMAALYFTLSAVPNPQVWYSGSAVDQEVHEHGVVLSRVRDRAIRGEAGLAYFEYAAGDEAAAVDPDDREAWARANPALGVRISEETVEAEKRAVDPKTFMVERLGVGDWFDPDGMSAQVISDAAWAARLDPSAKAGEPLGLSLDVNPERTWAAISAADDNRFVKVLEHRAGTGWLVDRAVALSTRFGVPVFVDEKSPAASFIDDLEEAGVRVERVNGQEYAQACGEFYDGVDQGTMTHEGSPELTVAVKGAVKRPLGDAWAWSRKNSNVDITPLVACTLVLWGVDHRVGGMPMAAFA